MASDKSAVVVTEDDYWAWLAWRLPRLADELTQLLPAEARAAGMQFEYGPLWAPFRDPPLTAATEWHYKGDVHAPCYRTASGQPVHFKPSCRCCR